MCIIHIYIYVFVYIYRERAMCVQVCMYMYIYIYIYVLNYTKDLLRASPPLCPVPRSLIVWSPASTTTWETSLHSKRFFSVARLPSIWFLNTEPDEKTGRKQDTCDHNPLPLKPPSPLTVFRHGNSLWPRITSPTGFAPWGPPRGCASSPRWELPREIPTNGDRSVGAHIWIE